MLHYNHLGNSLFLFFDYCTKQSVVYRVLRWQMVLFPQIFWVGFHEELKLTLLCFHLDGQASSSHFSIVSKPLFVLKPSEQKYVSRTQEYLKRI